MTLARMDAAEIDATVASPPTIGLGADADLGQPVAVHQHLVRRQAQAFDGALHREHRGVQDVERVDLGDAGLGDAERQRVGADLVEQAVALQRASAAWSR